MPRLLFMLNVTRCPSDFCAPPTVVTLTSQLSSLSMDVALPPRTRTRISFRFRTRLIPFIMIKCTISVSLKICINERINKFRSVCVLACVVYAVWHVSSSYLYIILILTPHRGMSTTIVIWWWWCWCWRLCKWIGTIYRTMANWIITKQIQDIPLILGLRNKLK